MGNPTAFRLQIDLFSLRLPFETSQLSSVGCAVEGNHTQPTPAPVVGLVSFVAAELKTDASLKFVI
jgi:hypothetical protein